MRDVAWRPPSPPESVASFSSTVLPFDSISQIGIGPPRHHQHRNHDRHSHRTSEGTARRSHRQPEVWRDPAASWPDPQSYQERPYYATSPYGLDRPQQGAQRTRHRPLRSRSNSPPSREYWATPTRTSALSSQVRSNSSTRRTPTASVHSQLASGSPATSNSCTPCEKYAPPSAHLIEEEIRTHHHLPSSKPAKVSRSGDVVYDVVQVELDSDEEEGNYHILRTHRYPVHAQALRGGKMQGWAGLDNA